MAEYNTSMNLDLTNDELMRYSRQILLDGWDIDAQNRLKYSTVLIVGMGGLGCPVSQILARAGVGKLHLIDFDVVDESNLQRQTLFTKDDVGCSKVKVAYQKLCRQNELISIDYTDVKLTDENICYYLRQILPDLVMDCTDNFVIRDLLNYVCRKNGLPLLSNSAIGEMGQIALFTKETGCYQCLFGDGGGDEQNCTTSGVMGSTVSIIGSMSAQVALDFLGRGNNPIADELILWQGRSMSFRKMRFVKNDACTVCAIATAF